MSEYIKEDTYDKEMALLSRLYSGFLFGIGAVMGLWFMSGLIYVILK